MNIVLHVAAARLENYPLLSLQPIWFKTLSQTATGSTRLKFKLNVFLLS